MPPELVERIRRALALPGRVSLTLADALARTQRAALPRDLVRAPGSRFNVPEESVVAPAGVNVPSDVNVFVSPNEMSRGEGFQSGRSVFFGGRVYPGQLAHELVHVEQDRRYGPMAQALYAAIAQYLQARGQNPYLRHPFEIEAEKARAEFERRAEIAAAYQRQRAGERR